MGSKIFLISVWQKWIKVSKLIAYYNTIFLVGLLFYLIFTPYGLVAKLFKIDFLDLKMSSNATTYWKEKENTDEEYYYKQY